MNDYDIYESLFPKEEYSYEWHMLPSERVALEYILRKLKPEVSIEIGTFKAGSLQVISRYS